MDLDANPFDGSSLDEALVVETLMGWDSPACATCGALLDGDPDEEVDGDAGLPICGECQRARMFDLDRFGEGR